MHSKAWLDERTHRARERYKLLIANMTTYGYALFGSAFVDPLTQASALKPVNGLIMAMALALHALAYYLAPRGEKP